MDSKKDIGIIPGKRTVLVVEDNDMNREILCELLGPEYNVLSARDGLEGLSVLEEHGEQIAVILLDVYMPVCSGFEFLERKLLNPRFDTVPVIVMTASDTPDDEIRCLRLGATDFVMKPYNTEVLKNRMMSVIRLKESAAMLNRLETDKLTGLYSREFFFNNVSQVIRSDPEGSYDIICTDIEGFRDMNDRYGRQRCDEFLEYIAKRMEEVLPGLIFGGRLGADVFAFLVKHREGDWSDVLRGAVDQYRSSHFTVKYGINSDVDPDVPVPTLCDRATLALSKVKGNYNRDVAVYDEEMRRIQLQERTIAETMQDALSGRQFSIYYQPKHDLLTGKTGGAEALVRWEHPQLGFLTPGNFIPLFENNGFITQLDFYIWDEVCAEISRWGELGLPVLPVSVNVSRRDFDLDDLAGQITALVDRHGIDRSLLHIEITESVYGDNPAHIAEELERLHSNGFIIELDDFGSGYSTLTSLRTMHPDIMKLDMSMIHYASETGDYGILRYAILLAECMKLKTLAEGVETQEQVNALRILNCDYVQGYYYSRPLPREEFEKYLASH